MGTGGELRQGNVYMKDSDGDLRVDQLDTNKRPTGSSRMKDMVGVLDCCDVNKYVYRGQLSWFGSPNGASCGNTYDYNCINGEEKRYTQTGGGCTSCFLADPICWPVSTGDTGWSASAPACGASGTYFVNPGISCSSRTSAECENDSLANCGSSPRVQACR